MSIFFNKYARFIVSMAMVFTLSSITRAAAAEKSAALTAVPFPRVKIVDDFWSPRIAVNRKTTAISPGKRERDAITAGRGRGLPYISVADEIDITDDIDSKAVQRIRAILRHQKR